MIVKLLTEYHLEFPNLKRDCTGSSESTLVKMPHCWKSHVRAHLILIGFVADCMAYKGFHFRFTCFQCFCPF